MASGRKEEVAAKGRARMQVGMDLRGVALSMVKKRRVIMDNRDRISAREVETTIGLWTLHFTKALLFLFCRVERRRALR